MLVKPSVAAKQFAADRAKQETGPGAIGPGYPQPGKGGTGQVGEGDLFGGDGDNGSTTKAVRPVPRRFHGSISLDPLRAGKDAGRVFEEVLQHLTSLMGADVEVTLEIQARVPEGVPENVVRTVMENCRTLKFTSHEFEAE